MGLNEEKTTIVNLTYTDVQTKRAEDILNTIIAVYRKNWLDDKNQMTVSTSRFITERLGVIEHELGDVDKDISSFKSANLLPDVETAAQQYMQKSSDLRQADPGSQLTPLHRTVYPQQSRRQSEQEPGVAIQYRYRQSGHRAADC